MRYWLLKTEPGEWSWEDQKSNGGISQWDGVKNKQAQKNLKSMKVRDFCFFYHSGSGPTDRRIVGVVEVIKPWYELTGDRGGAVDVRSRGEMRRTVSLKDLKEDPSMADFALVKQPRLSVVPVPEKIWEKICELGDGYCEEEEDQVNQDIA